MTMSHKEALEAVVLAVWDELGEVVHEEDAAVILRRYCEARGLVMVPKRITYPMSVEMNLTGTFKPEAMQVRYSAMLAAAPDPFGDAP